MKVIHHYSDLTHIESPRGVALGKFDGIHLGHQVLLKRMVKECRDKGYISTVYTFINHPGSILGSGNNYSEFPRITPLPLKKKIMSKLGVEVLFLDRFTESLMKMEPEMFVKEIIVDQMEAKLVVVGEDFRFGKKARGDIRTLTQLSGQYGFELIVVEPVYHKEQKISSSQIRNVIETGDMEEASVLLGRPFMMYNRVERGHGRGKTLGYPTANLILEEQQMVPAEGVYATYVNIDGHLFMGATSVGKNPTFGAEKTTIETYIIECNLMLYEREIELYFYKKIRDQITFKDADTLKNQIHQDVQEIKEYLQTKKTMIV